MLSVGLCALALTASAQKSYVIYQGTPLTEDQVQIPSNFYTWTHVNVTPMTDMENSPLKVSVGEGTPGWWGGGWMTDNFDCTPFTSADYDLMFDVKADEDFTTRVKLVTMIPQGGERAALELTYDFPHDGAWHTVKMPLRKMFASVVNAYQANDNMYAFTLIGGNDGAGKTFYVNNIRMQEHVVKAAVADKVYFGRKDCVMTPMGETMNNAVDYKFTTKADGSFDVEFNLLNPNVVGLTTPVCRINGVGAAITDLGGGKYRATSPAGFEMEENVNVVFGYAYAMGVTDVTVNYEFGSESAQTLPNPLLNVTLGEVTATSAVINWSMTLPEAIADATDLAVMLDGKRYTESPIVLSNLSQNTEYTLTLTGEATKGEVLTSAPATVNFRTLREGAVDITTSGKLVGTATGSLNGDLDYIINYSVTYTTDGKLKVTAKVNSAKEIIGLVPQLMINGPYKGNFANVNGTWEITTNDTYVADEKLILNIFLAYAGGAANNEFEYIVGQSENTTAVGRVLATQHSVDVYNCSGTLVRSASTASDALVGLPAGLYIVGGKKVLVK